MLHITQGTHPAYVPTYTHSVQLSVTTRTADQDAGTKLEYDIDGKILSQEPVSREVRVVSDLP